MASAESSDSFEFIAAALSALTNKETVSKNEYDVLRELARSGTDTGYAFKGRLEVPEAIVQTFIGNSIDRVAFWETLGTGVGGIVGATGGLAAGIFGTTVAIAAAPVSVPIILGTAVVGTVATAGGVVAGGYVGGVTGRVAGGAVGIALEVAGVVAVGAVVGVAALANFLNNRSATDGRTSAITMPKFNVSVFISCRDRGEVPLTIPSNQETIQQLKLHIREKLGTKPEDQNLIFRGTLLVHSRTVASYNITDYSVVKLYVKGKGGSIGLFFLDEKYLDPKWDRNFTDVDDRGKVFMRGGYQYHRPSGWMRIAIKVQGEYPGGEAWLGRTGSSGEWAVSYHGTERDVFNKICEDGYRRGGEGVEMKHGAVYGAGVYSSPHINLAEGYATKFQFGGIWYKGVFQNRINPRSLHIPKEQPDYWVCQKKGNIRPYGLCVKKM